MSYLDRLDCLCRLLGWDSEVDRDVTVQNLLARSGTPSSTADCPKLSRCRRQQYPTLQHPRADNCSDRFDVLGKRFEPTGSTYRNGFKMRAEELLKIRRHSGLRTRNRPACDVTHSRTRPPPRRRHPSRAMLRAGKGPNKYVFDVEQARSQKRGPPKPLGWLSELQEQRRPVDRRDREPKKATTGNGTMATYAKRTSMSQLARRLCLTQGYAQTVDDSER